MKVYAFPADEQGCGYYRIIWPSQVLKNMGVDVTIVGPGQRDSGMQGVMDGDVMVDVNIPRDADVIVLQRVSHKHIAQAVRLIRNKGVAVVVEIDDDLTCIDPRNPAFDLLHPNSKKYTEHSWHNTLDACRDATAVVVSTPALLRRFAPHGRGTVYENYVPAAMLDIPRVDSALIGWGGSVHSHPADLQVMGSSVARMIQNGYEFGVVGNGKGVHEAWGLPAGAPLHVAGVVPLDRWGSALAGLGIGVAPLADTKFNAAKSWLKMAEMAAAGVPCVGSPRAEYQRLADMGVGTTARNPGDWERKLRLLADNADARQEMSERGRDVMSGMTIEANAWKLAEIWKDALRLQRGRALGVHSRR